jgi:hypothetical protein
MKTTREDNDTLRLDLAERIVRCPFCCALAYSAKLQSCN